ncbi:hypothetical protein [Bradyrhizobium sp. 33ap4]|nr:hypothetical protein [Bradyrhizobium sp. 33ap4]
MHSVASGNANAPAFLIKNSTGFILCDGASGISGTRKTVRGQPTK